MAQRAALSWQRRGEGSPKGVLSYLLTGYKYNRARHFIFTEVHRITRSGGHKHKVLAWKSKCWSKKNFTMVWSNNRNPEGLSLEILKYLLSSEQPDLVGPALRVTWPGDLKMSLPTKITLWMCADTGSLCLTMQSGNLNADKKEVSSSCFKNYLCEVKPKKPQKKCPCFEVCTTLDPKWAS